MPKNILGVQEVYLHDYVLSARGRPSDLRGKVERFRALVHDMHDAKSGAFSAFLDALQAERGEGFSSFDLLQTHESWDVLVESYRREAAKESFLNFFWTWRYAYLPLLLAALTGHSGHASPAGSAPQRSTGTTTTTTVASHCASTRSTVGPSDG